MYNEIHGPEKLDCTDTLTLLLATEFKKGADSLIRPLLNNFPTSHETLLQNWPTIYDSFLMDHVLEIKQKMQTDFDETFRKIDTNYNGKRATGLTKSEIAHANALVKTRAIDWRLPSQAGIRKRSNNGCVSVALAKK